MKGVWALTNLTITKSHEKNNIPFFHHIASRQFFYLFSCAFCKEYYGFELSEDPLPLSRQVCPHCHHPLRERVSLHHTLFWDGTQWRDHEKHRYQVLVCRRCESLIASTAKSPVCLFCKQSEAEPVTVGVDTSWS
ncbi:ribosomal protein L40E [Alicyclobacillus tengchongensis]|uniref:Ribosomal protein L40E n=1 Tax=Alicyclobacillus tolerans TaxID=90970 RepID=A0ABT9LXG8_9BACL|nr:ribosomal protein L40E [Alicyclobacillus tengchongensis]